MKNNDRFKDLPWAQFLAQREHNKNLCLIGGAGGISSWTTLLLTRAGLYPYVYDADTIEAHNLGGQLFATKDIGQYKVDALYETVKTFTGVSIYVDRVMIDENSLTAPICIAGFDNMTARKIFYNNWKKELVNLPAEEKQEYIFIDGRLLAEQFQIFIIIGSDEERMKEYEEKYLFDDAEVGEALCTSKQTSHVAAMIGAYITSILTNHLTNLHFKKPLRAVPFQIEVHTPILMQEVI